MRDDEKKRQLSACMDCGLDYGSDQFQDLIIDDRSWEAIAPHGGLLCPNCINGRLVRAGLSEVKAEFRSGPMANYRCPPEFARGYRAGREDAAAVADPTVPTFNGGDSRSRALSERECYAKAIAAAIRALPVPSELDSQNTSDE